VPEARLALLKVWDLALAAEVLAAQAATTAPDSKHWFLPRSWDWAIAKQASESRVERQFAFRGTLSVRALISSGAVRFRFYGREHMRLGVPVIVGAFFTSFQVK
jgi:hypothetical protein